MNFEKRKTVIFMIFFTPYWISGTKEYVAKTLFEAAKYGIYSVYSHKSVVVADLAD